jgi:hypothetical protein
MIFITILKYQIAENSRLFQICTQTLEPFKVELVNNLR